MCTWIRKYHRPKNKVIWHTHIHMYRIVIFCPHQAAKFNRTHTHSTYMPDAKCIDVNVKTPKAVNRMLGISHIHSFLREYPGSTDVPSDHWNSANRPVFCPDTRVDVGFSKSKKFELANEIFIRRTLDERYWAMFSVSNNFEITFHDEMRKKIQIFYRQCSGTPCDVLKGNFIKIFETRFSEMVWARLKFSYHLNA